MSDLRASGNIEELPMSSYFSTAGYYNPGFWVQRLEIDNGNRSRKTAKGEMLADAYQRSQATLHAMGELFLR